MKRLCTLLAVAAISGGIVAPSAQATLAEFKVELAAKTAGKKGLSGAKAAASVLKKFANKEESLVKKFTNLATKTAYKLAASKTGQASVFLAKALKKLIAAKPFNPKFLGSLAVIIKRLKSSTKTDATIAAIFSAVSAGLSPQEAAFLCRFLYNVAGLPPNCPS